MLKRVISAKNLNLKNLEQGELNQNEKERNNFLFGIIGTNRTGKTSLALQIAREWRQSRPDGIVMSFDPQDKLGDVTDINITFESVDDILQLRNGLLILDDYKALHQGDKAEKWLSYLVQFRNHWNVDIIYIIHNPALVLNLLTYYTTHYFIFYTQSLEGGWRKKIPTYSLCDSSSKALAKYVSIYGRGEYPVFPYFIVDNENAKIYAKNINHNKLKGVITKINK